MPVMCDDCKCSNWLCKSCGEYGNDCDCDCCKCPCQRQDSTSLDVHIYKSDNPTNQQRSNTMTMINQPEPPLVIKMSEIDLLNIELANVKSTSDSLRDSLNRSRNNVRDIFTLINDYIEENDLDVDDDIPLSELNAMLTSAFGSELVFDKEYEVQVQYTAYATFTIRAKDEDAASDEAMNIEMFEPSFDEDAEDIQSEVDRIVYVNKKGR